MTICPHPDRTPVSPVDESEASSPGNREQKGYATRGFARSSTINNPLLLPLLILSREEQKKQKGTGCAYQG